MMFSKASIRRNIPLPFYHYNLQYLQMSTMNASPTQPKVSLRLLVNKKRNQVLFAEAGKEFIDILLSFLTLPLGTIVRLVAKDSNMKPVRFGCLSSLYGSVKNLDIDHFSTEVCKEMLLMPRNSMEDYCRSMKFNIDDTEPTKYFICENWDCVRHSYMSGYLTTFRNKKCPRHENYMMNREIFPESRNAENGFVKDRTIFIICSDLSVMPISDAVDLSSLSSLGIEDFDAIEEDVNVGVEEALDLLKCSLLSETPLTEMFLNKKICLETPPMYQSKMLFRDGKASETQEKKMVLKVLLRKSNKKVVLACAKEDVVDFLFGFLTIPMGAVLHMLGGCSCLPSIDKLYKSISTLCVDRCIGSQTVKDMLLNPKCAPKFRLSNQILPIGEACFPDYKCVSQCYSRGRCEGYLTTGAGEKNKTNTDMSFIDPKSPKGETFSAGGFVKGPAMYMVTDDLAVTPMSTISIVSILNSSKIPHADLDQRIINIGVKEGLSILRASLNSTSALTHLLKEFTCNVKVEK